MGYTVVERPIDKSELFVAEEVFLTGTAAKVTPVRRVECTDLSSERPVMNALRERITAITEGRDPNFEHWVTRIRIKRCTLSGETARSGAASSCLRWGDGNLAPTDGSWPR